MRTIKEILELMLEHKIYGNSGLCVWALSLRMNSIITSSEYMLLERYIEKNRPSIFSSLKAFRNRNKSFYWPMKDVDSRIKWINKHIEKNK